jgi:hypothetical protein
MMAANCWRQPPSTVDDYGADVSGEPLSPLFHYATLQCKLAFDPNGQKLIISGKSGTSIQSLHLNWKSPAQWQAEAELATGSRLDETGSVTRLSTAEMTERLRIRE